MRKTQRTHRYWLSIGISTALLTATASAASAQQVTYTTTDSFGNVVATPIPLGGNQPSSQQQTYTIKDGFGNTVVTPIPMGRREVVVGETIYYRSYPIGRQNIIDSTLINPVLINPNIRNSTIINPTIINEDYSWARVPLRRRSRFILKW